MLWWMVLRPVLYTTVLYGVPQDSVVWPILFLIYINNVSYLTLSDRSKLTIYADDILLYKPINHPEDYRGLQSDIDAIQDCISTIQLLDVEPTQMKISHLFKKETPPSTSNRIVIG